MLHIVLEPKNLIKNPYQNLFKIKQCCGLCCDPYVHQYALMDVWADCETKELMELVAASWSVLTA